MVPARLGGEGHHGASQAERMGHHGASQAGRGEAPQGEGKGATVPARLRGIGHHGASQAERDGAPWC